MKRRGSVFAAVCWGLTFFSSIATSIIYHSLWSGFVAALALLNMALQLFFYFQDKA